MILNDLIKWLEHQNPDSVIRHGFGEPYSYRGYYEDVAFEPESNTTIGEMLRCAKYALGRTFTGWKGGEFTMEGFTECWISEQGTTCGATAIGQTLLNYWREMEEDCAETNKQV